MMLIKSWKPLLSPDPRMWRRSLTSWVKAWWRHELSTCSAVLLIVDVISSVGGVGVLFVVSFIQIASFLCHIYWVKVLDAGSRLLSSVKIYWNWFRVTVPRDRKGHFFWSINVSESEPLEQILALELCRISKGFTSRNWGNKLMIYRYIRAFLTDLFRENVDVDSSYRL